MRMVTGGSHHQPRKPMPRSGLVRSALSARMGSSPTHSKHARFGLRPDILSQEHERRLRAESGHILHLLDLAANTERSEQSEARPKPLRGKAQAVFCLGADLPGHLECPVGGFKRTRNNPRSAPATQFGRN